MQDLLLKLMPLSLAVAACCGCNPQQTDQSSLASTLAANLGSVSLESEEEVQAVVSHAAACERAVIFVHLDWAFMEPHRTRFVEFMLEWQEKHPNEPVLFHYLDCTRITSGYRPLVNLPGWKELQDKEGTSLIHGWGEVAWLENGQVLHVERIINFQSAAELVEKTENLILR